VGRVMAASALRRNVGPHRGPNDISDLGALTAHHATAERLIVGIAGAVTIVRLARPAPEPANDRRGANP
jgi:hypothetical protein